MLAKGEIGRSKTIPSLAAITFVPVAWDSLSASWSWHRWVRGSLPGAFLLGAGLGITPSPCVTPVAMSVLAYASASGEVARGAALLFAFGLGHGIILFLLAAFAGVLQGMVRWRAWLRLLNPLMGISLMGFGFYLLTWGRHLFQHTM
ncbi:MAG: cytochrome c biogenesis protein CcdA [Bacillota bacterium]